MEGNYATLVSACFPILSNGGNFWYPSFNCNVEALVEKMSSAYERTCKNDRRSLACVEVLAGKIDEGNF